MGRGISHRREGWMTKDRERVGEDEGFHGV